MSAQMGAVRFSTEGAVDFSMEAIFAILDAGTLPQTAKLSRSSRCGVQPSTCSSAAGDVRLEPCCHAYSARYTEQPVGLMSQRLATFAPVQQRAYILAARKYISNHRDAAAGDDWAASVSAWDSSPRARASPGMQDSKNQVLLYNGGSLN